MIVEPSSPASCPGTVNRVCLLSTLSRWLEDNLCQRRAITVALLVSCFLLPKDFGQESKPVRRILILNEVGTSYPLINLVDEGIRAGLADAPYKIEFYREYMETVLFPDPADQQRFRDFYIRKYQDRKPDVIITVGSSPLQFIAETHRQSFPGVPVVFCFGNTPAETDVILDQDFTGIEGDVAAAATLDAALRLLPDTLHVFEVGGVAPYDRRQEAVVRKQLQPYSGRLDIAFLTDLAMPSLLERLKHLPSHSIVLLTVIGKDAAGSTFTTREVGPLVTSAANAPVFVMSDRLLNHGEVGGDVSRGSEQGRVVGEIALRLLNGARPSDIPIRKEASVYVFDWRTFERWGLKEKNLPPGSIVLNREISFWESNKQYVIAGILVFLAQTVAIFGLLWQRTRRRKVEIELGKSEEKFSKAFRHSPLAITIVRATDGRYIDVNEIFEINTGWLRDEVLGRTPQEIGLWVDPDQRSAFLRQLLENGNVKDIEVRYRRKDGQVRTSLGSAELIELHGEQCALSVIADITERKQAEEAMASISSRLIRAQEAERTRIARELHDDINQRLAMVAIILESTRKDLPASEIEANRQLTEAKSQIGELGNDLQALSHRLHSSRLDYLGLQVAASGFCREMSERHNVEIDFHYGDIPNGLSDQTSLCLFRVLQEALHNAVKYSGVDEFDVSFTGTSGEIELRVHDSGVGFDPKETSTGHGLGLISMKERLKLVSGDLSIDSKPGHGTTVLARVPLDRN
jgi:PAS domain S-box-containing protein